MKVLALLSIVCAAAAASDKLLIGITKKVTDCDHKATPGDLVSVHYTGTLEDGTEFDSSVRRGVPFDFTLGAHQVISGWDQGILGMCVGEKRRLTIPPHLAYGDQGAGPIPGGATILFDTELVAINGEPKAERDL